MSPHQHDRGIIFAISGQTDTEVTFSIDISDAKPAFKNPYDLWVSLEGYDEYSQLASRTNAAVRWQPPDDPHATIGYAGPFPKPPPGKGFAFVWQHPDAWTQLTAFSL